MQLPQPQARGSVFACGCSSVSPGARSTAGGNVHSARNTTRSGGSQRRLRPSSVSPLTLSPAPTAGISVSVACDSGAGSSPGVDEEKGAERRPARSGLTASALGPPPSIEEADHTSSTAPRPLPSRPPPLRRPAAAACRLSDGDGASGLLAPVVATARLPVSPDHTEAAIAAVALVTRRDAPTPAAARSDRLRGRAPRAPPTWPGLSSVARALPLALRARWAAGAEAANALEETARRQVATLAAAPRPGAATKPRGNGWPRRAAGDEELEDTAATAPGTLLLLCPLAAQPRAWASRLDASTHASSARCCCSEGNSSALSQLPNSASRRRDGGGAASPPRCRRRPRPCPAAPAAGGSSSGDDASAAVGAGAPSAPAGAPVASGLPWRVVDEERGGREEAAVDADAAAGGEQAGD